MELCRRMVSSYSFQCIQHECQSDEYTSTLGALSQSQLYTSEFSCYVYTLPVFSYPDPSGGGSGYETKCDPEIGRRSTIDYLNVCVVEILYDSTVHGHVSALMLVCACFANGTAMHQCWTISSVLCALKALLTEHIMRMPVFSHSTHAQDSQEVLQQVTYLCCVYFAETLEQGSQDQHMAEVDETTLSAGKHRLSKSTLKKLKARKKMKKLGIKKGRFYF